MPIYAQARPIVAIVGRPNVGKSTLFNRLSGRRIAIIQELPGVTRDRLYAECEWYGHPFVLIDTGGIDTGKDEFTDHIRRQANFAIEEADVIIFLVDGRDGLTHQDREISEMLRRTGKKVVLTVNKVESKQRKDESLEFYSLGFGEPLTISALHGMDVDTMLDTICDLLPPPPEILSEDDEDERLRMTIVGRPNVGKSSLLNALINEERAIVSPTAGTTRDSLDTDYVWHDIPFVITDTAGIRRKSKVNQDVEYYSVVRAFSAIDRSDIVVMMIDGTEGVTDQDKRIAGYANENGRGLVIAVNKWDLALIKARQDEGLQENEQLGTTERKKILDAFTTDVRHELIFANYAPIIFLSATKKKGLDELLTVVSEVAEQHSMRIQTGELNRLLAAATFEKPTSRRGRMLKIYYGTQVSTKPPTFALFVNDPALLHFSTERYLENQIRKQFSLEGTPVRFIIRESTGKESDNKPRNRHSRKTQDEV
ncbi:MAG: ribosome biogenesis GTPase Der [bacterium]